MSPETFLDPALREEVPACWTDEARAIAGTFRFGEGVKPWNWLELDQGEAEKLWALLVTFVAYFNRRSGERADRRIPPCWAEHGPLVEELTTPVFARWHAFESPHGSVGGAQYWHSYTLPGFFERVAGWLGDELLACQQGRHRDVEGAPIGTESAWSVRTEIIGILDVARRCPEATWGEVATSSVTVPVLGQPEVADLGHGQR
jgi:hypothetical protein